MCTFPVSKLGKIMILYGIITDSYYQHSEKKVCDGSFKEKLRQPGTM